MTVQQFIIDQTKHANEALLRQLRRTPAEKLTWSPDGKVRTILSVAQEVVQSTRWAPMMIKSPGKLEITDEMMQAAKAEAAQWDSLEKVEAALAAASEEFCKFVASIPDADLTREVPFPFGDETWTVARTLMVQYWNATYHLGQVCYVQTLYGDFDM